MYIKLGLTAVLLGFALGAAAQSCVALDEGNCSEAQHSRISGMTTYHCKNGDSIKLESAVCVGIAALEPYAKPTQKIIDGKNMFICENGVLTRGMPYISPHGIHGYKWTCNSSK